MHHSKIVQSLLVVLAFATQALGEETKTYPIKFTRAEKKGDQYNLKASSKDTSDQKLIIKDKIVRREKKDTAVALEGQAEVIEVNSRGLMTKLKLAVKKFTVRSGEDPMKNAAKAGQVLTVEFANLKASFSLDGKPVDAEIANILELIFLQPESPFKGGLDDLFGSEVPRSINTQWNGKAEGVIKQFQPLMKFAGHEADPICTVKLDKLVKQSGLESCVITSSTKFKPTGFQEKAGEAKTTKSDATFIFQTSHTLPVDVTLPEVAAETIVQFDLKSHLVDESGHEAQITLTGGSTIKQSRSPIK